MIFRTAFNVDVALRYKRLSYQRFVRKRKSPRSSLSGGCDDHRLRIILERTGLCYAGNLNFDISCRINRISVSVLCKIIEAMDQLCPLVFGNLHDKLQRIPVIPEPPCVKCRVICRRSTAIKIFCSIRSKASDDLRLRFSLAPLTTPNALDYFVPFSAFFEPLSLAHARSKFQHMFLGLTALRSCDVF